MRRSFIYLFILLLLGSANAAFAQNGEIYGEVLDESGAPFPGVVIKVTQGGLLKSGTVSEDDGTYSVKPLQPGTYDVEFSAVSYQNIKLTGVEVSLGGSVKKNMKMKLGNAAELTTVTVVSQKSVITKEKVVDAKTIESSANRNLVDVAALTAGVHQTRSGGELRIGGARGDGTLYMIDGQVVNGGGYTPALGTVSQLQVFTSGLPANLGDATGGVVSVTTKGLTNKFQGNVQAQRSIDGYNQNLLNASFTGPLVMKVRDGIKQPVLGFVAGLDYLYNEDDNPTFTKNPVLKGDVLKSMQENPLTLVNTPNGTILQPTSTFAKKEDFVLQKQQVNNSSQTIRFNGKLDYALNQNINITVGGSYLNQLADGYSRVASYFAPESIPQQRSDIMRGYVRFKQSFTNLNRSASRDSVKRSPVISNAFYTLQLDYQLSTSQSEHRDFKRNLFDYGYVGRFNQSRTPIYQFGTDSLTGREGVVLQTYDAVNGISFQASDKNPILARYTQSVFDNAGKLGGVNSAADIQNGRTNGLMNGDFPLEALFQQNVRISNIGAGQTGYSYGTFDQIGFHADASFDFKPKKTVHAIQFGLYYEQRTSRNYSATINNGGTGTGYNSLWNLMNQLVNRHIQLDYDNPVFIHNGQRYSRSQVDAGAFFGPTDTILYERKSNGEEAVFSQNLRNRLGLGTLDYVDIQSVDPTKLSLDLFSADEILNQGSSFVGYNGYDYTGNRLKGRVNFNDFFTQKDANGNLARPIGAFSPNYIAGYVMDKFRFKEMNFNIGVRIERYDNNTKVLKDPYSLYELNTKGTVDGSRNPNGSHPGNIGNDYAVYVNNNQTTNPIIIGYRNGDRWYNANGVEISDPAALKNNNDGIDPQPYLTEDGKVGISDPNFDPNKSFTDYVPKVTASPRFQFDFPIMGDKALFYAHYDILVQRPKTGNFASPLDYMYLDRNQGSIIGNPDLKPERTFDYELGYKQELTRYSGIGISAFYKERKDMIQVRPYLYAWPRTYYTYGNRDFSTTKGFAFTYDYRKNPNSKVPLDISVAYTLQFADGTGSSAASSNGGNGNQVASTGLMQNFILAGLPNLRYVAPLTYDSRHIINMNLTYSYDEKEGPTVNGKHILQNFTANIIMRARSGEPYTTYQNPVGNAIQGGLNGTRLNWHFGCDFRMDKRFALNGYPKKTAEGEIVQSNVSRKYYISAFVLFQNIFNIKDVLGVYPYTSRPDDDGYVTSTNGDQFFNAQVNSDNLRNLYSLYINNPGFYNMPRRANIGVAFSF